jgi:hypothetical protein
MQVQVQVQVPRQTERMTTRGARTIHSPVLPWPYISPPNASSRECWHTE